MTLQLHNHYSCYASMGASILTLGDISLIIKLGYLGVILQFLYDSEMEIVHNYREVSSVLNKSQWINSGRKPSLGLEYVDPAVNY